MYELILIEELVRGGKTNFVQPGEYNTIESAVLAGLKHGTSFMVWGIGTHQLVGEWTHGWSGNE